MACDWELQEDIRLDVRPLADGTGEEYWAHFEVLGPTLFALARVLPLVSQPEPSYVSYLEDSPRVPLIPGIELSVKSINSWDEKFPNLRIRSVDLSIVEGYVPGDDLLTMLEVPGFEASWDEEGGVLTVSAVPGFDFTDNTEVCPLGLALSHALLVDGCYLLPPFSIALHALGSRNLSA